MSRTSRKPTRSRLGLKRCSSYGVLPMDAPAFREWARLMHRRSDAVSENAMIAAMAIMRRLTVVTRNTGDFMQFGVELHNPWPDG